MSGKVCKGFPHSSVGKESACNAGDLSWIPGSGRPLEKRKATHSSILAWRIPWTIVHRGCKELDMIFTFKVCKVPYFTLLCTAFLKCKSEKLSATFQQWWSYRVAPSMKSTQWGLCLHNPKHLD